MADTVEFELVSPEQLLLSGPVEMVVVPGSEGDFGVLPGHAPIISTVRTGVISTYENGAVDRRIFVAGGFAEVTGLRCTVLAEEAIALDEIDRTVAEARLVEAQAAVNDAIDDQQRTTAQERLSIAEALLRAINQ